MSKDYYNILGIQKGATDDEIKKAFRKKAHEYHPDKKTGDEAKFKEVNEAYQVLSNKQKRAQYDQFGSDFVNGQAGGQGGFGGFSQGGININMDDLGDMFGGFGDIFGFGGGSGRSKGQRNGADMQMALDLSFTEAVFGAEKNLSLRKKVKCGHCKGNLAEPGTKINTCSTCGGSGRVNKVQRTILGNMQVQAVCDDCQGEGKTYEKKCTKCGGSGVVIDNVNLKVKIPAGINDGESIRLSGQGEAGEAGAPAGDLYLRIRVENSKDFVREGYDIKTQKEISFTQAALGDKIEIETIEGKVKLKIPAGTQSGTIFKIKNKGVVRLQGSGKGDHFVKVRIKTPTTLNRKQKELLKELSL
jgi:molecular chaperone DnaJ